MDNAQTDAGKTDSIAVNGLAYAGKLLAHLIWCEKMLSGLIPGTAQLDAIRATIASAALGEPQ